MQTELLTDVEQEELEKYPPTDITYRGRPLPDGRIVPIDMRLFLTWDTLSIRREVNKLYLIGNLDEDQTLDTKMGVVQAYVCKRGEYVDDNRFGVPEYFLFPWETLAMTTPDGNLAGDCEDLAWLMAAMMIKVLPPEHRWRVRFDAGLVKTGVGAETGGHGWARYRRMLDDKTVPMDWCYAPDPEIPLEEKVPLNENGAYLTCWWSIGWQGGYHGDAGLELTVAGRLRRADSADADSAMPT